MLHNGSASVFQTDGESSILSIRSRSSDPEQVAREIVYPKPTCYSGREKVFRLMNPMTTP